uniref:TBC1 domain family, member 13 n=1 Tax=Mus musculus TaxID=10090 RepID=D6RJI8_MOUSE
MSSLHKSRIADFQDVLKEPSIVLEKLRELSFSALQKLAFPFWSGVEAPEGKLPVLIVQSSDCTSHLS